MYSFQYARRRKHVVVGTNPFDATYELYNGIYRSITNLRNCDAVKWLKIYHPDKVDEFIDECIKQRAWEYMIDIIDGAANQINNFIIWAHTEHEHLWAILHNQANRTS